MDAEVAPVGEIAQRFSGNAPQPDLQRRAVIDDAGNVTGNLLHDLLGDRHVDVFRDRRIHRHQDVDVADVQGAVALRARHRRVHLGNARLAALTAAGMMSTDTPRLT